MSGMRAAWRLVLGLFIDDGRFAGAVLAWVAFCGLLLRRLPVPYWLPPLVLFVGLAAILIEASARRARRDMRR